MTVRQSRLLLATAPLIALSLLGASLGRKEIIALAREKFPAVMNRKEPAHFLVMVFDSADRYVWGFPVKGSVTINLSGDTLTPTDRRDFQARQGAAGMIPIPSGRANPYAKSDGTLHGTTHFLPAYFRDSTRAMRILPMNTDDGLVPTGPHSIESGIDGVLARNVVHVDRFTLYPGEDPPLQFEILTVHLDVVTDTGRPARTRIPLPPPPLRDITPPGVKKKARMKTLVILPVPIPEAASPYDLEACFDVAPKGDAKLLTWNRSRDMDYNSKVKKSLDRYQFWPATLDGVAVRDTVCIHARAARSGD